MKETYFVFKDSDGIMVMVPCNQVAIERGVCITIRCLNRSAHWRSNDGRIFIREVSDALDMVMQ